MPPSRLLLAAPAPSSEPDPELIKAIAGCCSLILLLFVVWIAFRIVRWFFRLLFGGGSPARRRCTWCGRSKLRFVEGHQGEWTWQYRNKGGGRDKRVKGNYQTASYNSIWECGKCGARTMFKHYMSRRPSKNVKIWKATNIRSGEGEQTNGDYEIEGGTLVDRTAANRKGDD